MEVYCRRPKATALYWYKLGHTGTYIYVCPTLLHLLRMPLAAKASKNLVASMKQTARGYLYSSRMLDMGA